MYYKDQTKLYLPKVIGEQVLIPYEDGEYTSKWGVRIKRIIDKRATRCNPRKKFSWQKTAAGLLVTRLL